MDSALVIALGDAIGVALVVGVLFAFALGMSLTFAYQAIRYWPRGSERASKRRGRRSHAETKIPREHPRAT